MRKKVYVLDNPIPENDMDMVNHEEIVANKKNVDDATKVSYITMSL